MNNFKKYYPDIMTTQTASDILNISQNHCLYLLRSGKLKGFKINKSRNWRITSVALEEYINHSFQNFQNSP